MPKYEDVFQADGTLVLVRSPIPAGEAMRITYYCQHLPTGKKFPRQALFRNRAAFLKCLEKWNRQDNWYYAETEEEVNSGQSV